MGAILGIPFGIVTALVGGIGFFLLTGGFSNAIWAGIVGMLFPFLYVFLQLFLADGKDTLRHYVLAFAKIIPFQFSHFLGDMTRCHILRQLGKEYVFIHRIVHEYFVQQGRVPPAESAV